MENIFAYAAKRVANKNAWSRIAHSSTLHSMRSATKSSGSFGSKLVSFAGASVRATANAIPIPVVGGLVAAIEGKVEAYIKSRGHAGNLQKATTTEDKVKFTLKEINVEDMDRLRWKVADAIKELNEAMRDLSVEIVKKRQELRPCDAYYEAACAWAQARRRLKKLTDAAAALIAAMALTAKWINEVETGKATIPALSLELSSEITGGLARTEIDLRNFYKKYVKEERFHYFNLATQQMRDAYVGLEHANCGDFCVYRKEGKVDTLAAIRDDFAAVIRVLAEPFNPDSFNNNLGSLWTAD
jgi:hypothetical protein